MAERTKLVLTDEQRLDITDLYRIPGYVYAHLYDVLHAVFNRSYASSPENSIGGLLRASAAMGPQPKDSSATVDTDWLVNEFTNFPATAAGTIEKTAVLKKKMIGNTNKWVVRINSKNPMYVAPSWSPLGGLSQAAATRVFATTRNDVQVAANTVAADNPIISGSSKSPWIYKDISDAVRAVEADVPNEDKFTIVKLTGAEGAVSGYPHLTPFHVMVTTVTNHGFTDGDYVKLSGVDANFGALTFDGTHLIMLPPTGDKTKRFLLYSGLPGTGGLIDEVDTFVVDAICWKKQRFKIFAGPSAYGQLEHPNLTADIESDTPPQMSDFEKRKFINTVTGKTTEQTVGTRLREVVYAQTLKVSGAASDAGLSLLDSTNLAEIIECPGYTDEWTSVFIPGDTRFKTILNEDDPQAVNQTIYWHHQVFLPTSMIVAGYTEGYTVTVEIYDLDGNTPRDENGIDLYKSAVIVDKQSSTFKIQLEKNQLATWSKKTKQEPIEGGQVEFEIQSVASYAFVTDGDVIIRWKVDDDHAMPHLIPRFAYDQEPIVSKSGRNTVFAGQTAFQLKGESFLAQGVPGIVDWDPAKALEYVGYDLPLWNKKKAKAHEVKFTSNNIPGSGTYTVDCVATDGEGSTLTDVQDGFTTQNKTRNGFLAYFDTLPEPTIGSLAGVLSDVEGDASVTGQNGSAVVVLSIYEKSLHIRVPLCTYGDFYLSKLQYAYQAEAGVLSWVRKGPNTFIVYLSSGADSSQFCAFDWTVKTLHYPGNRYSDSAVDGTFGGNARMGGGVLAQLGVIRDVLWKMQTASPLYPNIWVNLQDGTSEVPPPDEKLLGPWKTKTSPAGGYEYAFQSIRDLAKRLQRVKTILHNNNLIALDGIDSLGDSTEILATGHLKGAVGGEEGADPAAAAGTAAFVLASGVAVLPADISQVNVLWPPEYKLKIDKGYVEAPEPVQYVVLLDVQVASGASGFSVSNKTDKGFQLFAITAPNGASARIRWRICSKTTGDELLVSAAAAPLTKPAEAIAYSGTDTFNVNNVLSVGASISAVHDRLDVVRGQLRNGQTIPTMWIEFNYKSNDYPYVDGSLQYPPLEIKSWGNGDSPGYSFIPRIVLQEKVWQNGAGSYEAALGYPWDVDVLLRVFYGSVDGGGAFLQYDPAHGALDPFKTFSEPLQGALEKPIDQMSAEEQEEFIAQAGFAGSAAASYDPGPFKAAFITQNLSLPDYWFTGEEYDPDTDPPSFPFPDFADGVSSAVIEKMPLAKTPFLGTFPNDPDVFGADAGMIFRDFEIRFPRTYNGYGPTSMNAVDNNPIWTLKTPFQILFVGRPDGTIYDFETGSWGSFITEESEGYYTEPDD